MSKKIIVYPVLVGSICNVPFKRLNQRDFIDLCTADYTINSRNSNVGALMEIRTDDRMLGNIDPDTHFLFSNNRITSNYYNENELTRCQIT